MPPKLSEKVCPICKQRGGFLVHRPVKYVINIPPRRKIKTLVAPWDYAARVCLKKSDFIMLFPPVDSKPITKFNSFFDIWKRINLHDDTEIELFESKLMKVIPKSLKSRTKYLNSKYSRSKEYYDKTIKNIREPIHIRLPKKTGIPTKSSVGFVYAACVCLTLRDIFGQFSFDNNDQLIRGLYSYFSIVQSMTDLRVLQPWINYFKIYEDMDKHGYSYYKSFKADKTSIEYL